ncbi:hypothetical protein JAAARDRAFT_35129 [Jaapia argillacea MUCL 33604]|uniref:Uncharacterized protein n=1 Tax=Jaapia argillacea MUCL 33604 TaxID=933084 RepID=A0A067Q1P0_9AGAM|nr:hypothetical protein JAAARDRAFT_35129 [Jaapia argillacea MUCL 33604]
MYANDEFVEEHQHQHDPRLPKHGCPPSIRSHSLSTINMRASNQVSHGSTRSSHPTPESPLLTSPWRVATCHSRQAGGGNHGSR